MVIVGSAFSVVVVANPSPRVDDISPGGWRGSVLVGSSSFHLSSALIFGWYRLLSQVTRVSYTTHFLERLLYLLTAS